MNEEQKAPYMDPSPKSSPAVGVVIGLIVVLAAGGFIYSRSKSPTEPIVTEPTNENNRMMGTAPSSTIPSTPSGNFASYKDGTYTAEGEYAVHRGPEKVTISLTLKNGVVTDTTFAGTPAFAMSQRFMDMFSQEYKTMVVGKNINEIKLDKVSGSSLTPMGFNNALEKIKLQAGVAS